MPTERDRTREIHKEAPDAMRRRRGDDADIMTLMAACVLCGCTNKIVMVVKSW